MFHIEYIQEAYVSEQALEHSCHPSLFDEMGA
jgi:hypothetical protein